MNTKLQQQRQAIIDVLYSTELQGHGAEDYADAILQRLEDLRMLELCIVKAEKRKFLPVETFDTIRLYTPEDITSLRRNEIFVFGSNTQGQHLGGAAKFALDNFGAISGCGTGPQGKSYAIATCDLHYGKMAKDVLYRQISTFLVFARVNKEFTYYVTKIGTGIAGFTVEEMANMFSIANKYDGITNNVILPYEFECRE